MTWDGIVSIVDLSDIWWVAKVADSSWNAARTAVNALCQGMEGGFKIP